MATLVDRRDPIPMPSVLQPVPGAGDVARRLGDLVPELADALFAANVPGVHREALALVERTLIARALERTGGNQLRAARLLGINRNTLRKRCRLLGLPVPGARPLSSAAVG